MLTNVNGESISTLTLRRNEKTLKYKELINDCHSQFHYEAKLFVFVVSSLGDVPNETINELKLVVGSTKVALKLASRMTTAALCETMLLYSQWMKSNSNDPDNSQQTMDNSDNIIDIVNCLLWYRSKGRNNDNE